MGLGKTIACVSLVASTLPSAREFAKIPIIPPTPPPPSITTPMAQMQIDQQQSSSPFFQNGLWGTPGMTTPSSPASTAGLSKKALAKLKAADKAEGNHYARQIRVKTRSRATLVICPLSTVANWEDQFKEHWRGAVSIVGGSGDGGSGAGGGKGKGTKKEKERESGQTVLNFWKSQSSAPATP